MQLIEYFIRLVSQIVRNACSTLQMQSKAHGKKNRRNPIKSEREYLWDEISFRLFAQPQDACESQEEKSWKLRKSQEIAIYIQIAIN